jgi:hypothetical protein
MTAGAERDGEPIARMLTGAPTPGALQTICRIFSVPGSSHILISSASSIDQVPTILML